MLAWAIEGTLFFFLTFIFYLKISYLEITSKLEKSCKNNTENTYTPFYPDSQIFNILAHLSHVNLFIIVRFESFESWYDTLCLDISMYIS